MQLMVGVSGVRGIVGKTLTPRVALDFAQAYGTLLGGGRVVLARDSRPSGTMFEAAAAAGLLAAGCQVTQLGLVMTPTVGRAIREGKYDGGMIITASHNPSQWNGLKFLDDMGVAPDPELARQIASIREKQEFRSLESGIAPLDTDAEAGQRHVDAVVDACETSVTGLRVVLDSINGAGCVHTPLLLQRLGCELIHINGEPTGDFAHEPEPIAANLQGLCQAVREHGAAVGFAQDPDADRLAIVDEQGTYIGEEYTLALAVKWVLSQRPGPVAANLSTSRMIDDLAREYGVEVIRTPVGESHVARSMLKHGCTIGGEGNGGVIDPRICYVRDSLSSISFILQLLSAEGRPLSQIVAQMPHYASVKEKFPAPRDVIIKAVEEVAKEFANLKPNISDGVRVDFERGWVHLRASNTEPIVRIIAEADSEQAGRELVERVRSAANL